MAMSEIGLRAVILKRLEIVNGQCNSTYIDHNDGLFRGLLWALTGEDPGTHILRDVERLLTLAGIPNHREGDRVVLE